MLLIPVGLIGFILMLPALFRVLSVAQSHFPDSPEQVKAAMERASLMATVAAIWAGFCHNQQLGAAAAMCWLWAVVSVFVMVVAYVNSRHVSCNWRTYVTPVLYSTPMILLCVIDGAGPISLVTSLVVLCPLLLYSADPAEVSYPAFDLLVLSLGCVMWMMYLDDHDASLISLAVPVLFVPALLVAAALKRNGR